MNPETDTIILGSQLVLDGHHCPPEIFDGVSVIKDLIYALADLLGTEILQEGFHVFTPQGVTGFAIVSASHIAVHTWPEYQYVGVDIFSCRDIQLQAVLALLAEKLPGSVFSHRLFQRGIV